MTDLLQQCRAKLAELDSLRPIQPEQEARILQKLRLDWDFHSNHLEGNSLTYGETTALILHGLTAQGKPMKDHIEVTGHHEAVKWIEDLVRQRAPLTEAVVRELHRLILHEDHYIDALTPEGKPTQILVQVGSYKVHANHVRTVTGETLFFSSPTDTPIHMHELLDWYTANQDVDPIELASTFQHRFTRIHPFADGNGRVARLVSNFILMMAGYPPAIIRTQEKDGYFAALRLADAGDPASFAAYLAARLLDSLDLVFRGARGEPIEETDDIRKELALLRQRFEAADDKVNVVRSAEGSLSAWENWIEPLLVEFDVRSRQFESFYLERKAAVLLNGAARGNDVEEQLSAARGKISGAREVAIRVEYSKVKTRQHVQKSFSSGLKIQLLDTHADIFDFENRKLAEVDWDQHPPQAQRAEWIAAEERRHLHFLKNIVAS